MAEKYQARYNSEEFLVEEKTEKEKRQDSSTKVAKVAAKAAGEYFAPGVGGKVVDLASNTKAGQAILNTAGKTLAKNPITGRIAKKLDDSGMVDVADQATDLIGGKPSSNLAGNSADMISPDMTKTASNSSKGFSPLSKLNSEINETEQKANTKNLSFANNVTSQLSQKFSNNKFLGDLSASLSEHEKERNDAKKKLKMLKVKKRRLLIMFFGGFFSFIILITAIVAAKDHSNLSITNNSQAMGNYQPELIGAVTPGSISEISDELINGGEAVIISGGQTLESILGQEGINLINQSIITSVQAAGIGTGAAPAAAAQSLIQNLLSQGLILPYFWGGGHGKIQTGVSGNWGKITKVTAPLSKTSYTNQPLGLDCSGFVSWALYNAGCKNFTPILADDFKNLGPSTTFSNAKTGDIASSEKHVVLILENRGNKLLVAEAKSPERGVIFSEYDEKYFKKYIFVDMSNYYQNNCS